MVQKDSIGSDVNGQSTVDNRRRRGLSGALRHGLSALVGAWMSVVRVFSWFAARVVGTVLFVLVFVPYSVVMRVARFDPLDREPDPATESYWTDPEATNTDLEEFRKLY